MTWPQAINVMVDQLPNQFIIPMGSNDLCGQSQVENSYNINLSLIHSYPTTIISIFSSIDSTSIYWGIRELVLSVDTCPPGCQICFQESQVFECSQWKLFHESWMSKDLRDFNADGWQTTQVSGPTDCASISMYGGYNSMTVGGALQKTFQLGAHSNLYFIYRFIKIDNWSGEYDMKKNCKIRVIIHSKQRMRIIKCYIMVEEHKRTIVEILVILINFIYMEQSILMMDNLQQCQQLANNTIREDILVSEIFKYMDVIVNLLIKDTTPSYCGDGIVDYNEQCDDGNIYAFDSCFNCQFYCVEGCSNCITGMCINCQEGWVFDILNYQCIYQQFQLLDKQIEYQIVQKQDNIHILTYKEKDCKEFNYQNQCIKCKKGYQLDWQGTCQTVCGDGIIAGIEEYKFEIEFKNIQHSFFILQQLAQQLISCQFQMERNNKIVESEFFLDQTIYCKLNKIQSFKLNQRLLEQQIKIEMINHNEECEIGILKNCNKNCKYQCYNKNANNVFLVDVNNVDLVLNYRIINVQRDVEIGRFRERKNVTMGI